MDDDWDDSDDGECGRGGGWESLVDCVGGVVWRPTTGDGGDCVCDGVWCVRSHHISLFGWFKRYRLMLLARASRSKGYSATVRLHLRFLLTTFLSITLLLFCVDCVLCVFASKDNELGFVFSVSHDDWECLGDCVEGVASTHNELGFVFSVSLLYVIFWDENHQYGVWWLILYVVLTCEFSSPFDDSELCWVIRAHSASGVFSDWIWEGRIMYDLLISVLIRSFVSLVMWNSQIFLLLFVMGTSFANILSLLILHVLGLSYNT